MKALVVVAASVCAAISLAPLGAATTDDDGFLAMLADAGIPAHDGIPSVIAAGHEVCAELDGGASAADIANKLANDAYADAPVNSLDRYQRSMARFVQVSAQAFCPAHAGSAAWRGGYRVVLIDDLPAPQPIPAMPEEPDIAHLKPPTVATKPVQSPPPPKRQPPPPERVPQPSQGGPGGGAEGGGDGGGVQPAPDLPGGHIVLLP